MPEEYLIPRLSARGYEALRALPILNLPDTFDGWRKMIADRRLEYGQRAFVVVEVDVYPDEYTTFCKARRHAYNLKTLADFVCEKRAAQK